MKRGSSWVDSMLNEKTDCLCITGLSGVSDLGHRTIVSSLLQDLPVSANYFYTLSTSNFDC